MGGLVVGEHEALAVEVHAVEVHVAEDHVEEAHVEVAHAAEVHAVEVHAVRDQVVGRETHASVQRPPRKTRRDWQHPWCLIQMECPRGPCRMMACLWKAARAR